MSDYKPISCEFHEVLESLAMTHKNADVEYQIGRASCRERV